MKRVLLLLLLLLLGTNVEALRVKVRLFSTERVETLNVSFDLGSYDLLCRPSKKATRDSLLEPSVDMAFSVILSADARGVRGAVIDY